MVINKHGARKQHAHFKHERGAIIFLSLMKRCVLPDNKWMRESASRVFGGPDSPEFKKLRPSKKKQKYINKKR
jgi:hypothetical protein